MVAGWRSRVWLLGGLTVRLDSDPRRRVATALGWVELSLTMIAVLMVIDLIWVALAARARTFFRSARAVRAANRAGATIMAGAAATIAARY